LALLPNLSAGERDSEAAVPQLAITPLDHSKLEFAVRLHAVALPHGFFVRLGRRYLRAYYTTFVDGPDAVALLATLDGLPAGILVGTTANARHYAWVVRHRSLRLALCGVLGLLARPPVALAFVRSRLLRYLRGLVRLCRASKPSARAATATMASDVAVLTHVAVAEVVQGHGVGAALVRAFEQAAVHAGGRRAVLVTLAGPHGAAGMYEQLGWNSTGQRHDHDGRAISEYTRELH